MDTLRGWRTIIVAAIFVVNGVAVAMGWTPTGEELPQLAGIVAAIQGLLTNPIVAGAIMALMRWATTTPVGVKGD